MQHIINVATIVVMALALGTDGIAPIAIMCLFAIQIFLKDKELKEALA